MTDFWLQDEFWEAERKKLAAIMAPHIQAMASAGVNDAERNLTKIGIYFDNTLPHTLAAKWAREHTDQVLVDFMSRTQGMVGEKIASFIETPGATNGDLVKILKPILDDNLARAWSVAITETTRAISEGNDLAYKAAGVPPMAYKPPAHPNCRCTTAVKHIRSSNEWVVVWVTEQDGVVCTKPLIVPWGTVGGCHALQGVIISQGEHLGKKFGDVA